MSIVDIPERRRLCVRDSVCPRGLVCVVVEVPVPTHTRTGAAGNSGHRGVYAHRELPILLDDGESVEAAMFRFLTQHEMVASLNQTIALDMMDALREARRRATLLAHTIPTTKPMQRTVPKDVARDLYACPRALLEHLHTYSAVHREGRAALDAGRPTRTRTLVHDCALPRTSGQDVQNLTGLAAMQYREAVAECLRGMVATFLVAMRHRLIFFSRAAGVSDGLYSPFLNWRVDESWQDVRLLMSNDTAATQQCDCEAACRWPHAAALMQVLAQLGNAGDTRVPIRVTTQTCCSTTCGAKWMRPAQSTSQPVELHAEYLSTVVGKDIGCAYWALLRPTPALLSVIGPHLARVEQELSLGVYVPGNTVVDGVHQAGDMAAVGLFRLLHGIVSPMEPWMQCLRQNASQSIFVVSDAVGAARKLRMFPRSWARSYQHASGSINGLFMAMIADWMLLAACPRILALPSPTSSMFTLTAMAYGRRQRVPPPRESLLSSSQCPLVDELRAVVSNMHERRFAL